jgi:hypothetical protein
MMKKDDELAKVLRLLEVTGDFIFQSSLSLTNGF